MPDLIIERPGLNEADAVNLKAAFEAESVRILPNALRLEGLSKSAAAFLRAGIGDVPPAEVLPVPQGLSAADIRLMAFDMESTLIENECLDDMTEIAGEGKIGRELTRHGLVERHPANAHHLGIVCHTRLVTDVLFQELLVLIGVIVQRQGKRQMEYQPVYTVH